MGLRPRRRNLVVWRQSAGPAGRHADPRSARPTRARRIRRLIRTGALLAITGLMPLARGVQARWRFLLPGTVLTVVGVVLRGSAASIVLLPGLVLLLSAPLMPARSPDRTRRSELERELAVYSTPAQRRDLEATLDRYPDEVTSELREILASQAVARRR
jgi:hypothetical protein